MMKQISPIKLSLLALGGFILYYAALFILYPLQHSLIGNSDVIVHLAYFYEYFNNAKEVLTGTSLGNSFYPADGIRHYMESYLGETVMFFLARAFTASDLWAYFLFYVILFALNGWSVYLLSNYYIKHRWAAFIAGIIFSSSCFMMSTLELLNGLAFFCVPLSIYFLEKFIDQSKYKYLLISAVLLALESFFSAYHCLMGSLVWLVLFVTRFRMVYKFNLAKMAFAVIPSILLIIPLFVKVFSPELTDAVDPMKSIESVYVRFSLNFKSFITSIPNNLIYPRGDELNTAIKTSYRANLGILCLILLIIGITRKFPRKYTYLCLLLIATIFSFGPYTIINGQHFRLPTAFVYENNFFGTFFRMPGRAFVISNFIIALICGVGFKILIEKIKFYPLILASATILIFSIENQAIPPYTYSHKDLLVTPIEYKEINANGAIVTIADFPSSLFTDTGYKNGVSEFSREFMYQYWQTKHHQNTLNGGASYYSKTRMKNNNLMMNVEEHDNLEKLISDNDLKYIVYHKDLVLNDSEENLLTFFTNSPFLEQKVEGNRLVIFDIVER